MKNIIIRILGINLLLACVGPTPVLTGRASAARLGCYAGEPQRSFWILRLPVENDFVLRHFELIRVADGGTPRPLCFPGEPDCPFEQS